MDSKLSLSRVIRIANTDMYKWLTNPRMIIAASLIVFMWNFAVEPLVKISNEMNSPLNCIEPFIAVFNSRTLCLITPAVYMFLISDYPHLDRNSLFFLHRVRKREWVMGQFLFFVNSSFIFIMLIFVCTIIPNAPKSFIADGWSLVVTKYGVYNPEKAYSFATNLITKDLYTQMSPYHTALFSFFLNWLYMILIGNIMLMFHVLNMRKIGLPTVVGIIGVGSALGVFSSKGMWFFPMAHTMVSLHYTEYIKEPTMSMRNSYLYFIVIILILFCVSLLRVTKTDFIIRDDEQE